MCGWGSTVFVSDHFVEADEMVVIGSGAHWALAIVMKGDLTKPVIAVGQTYLRTRNASLCAMK
jgi:hypothetical protein